MSDQPPQQGGLAGRHVSADGRWVWNGSAWVPNTPTPGPMAAPYSPPVMQYSPPTYPPTVGYSVAPKSPAVSLIVSFFLPGVGSLVNGDTAVGLIILFLWLLGFGLDITVIGLVVGIPLGLAMFIWGLIDAYQGARRWNARHGIIS